MTVVRVETVSLPPATAYRGTFAPSAQVPVAGGELPAGWEGLYFPFDAALADLRPDGSPASDGVLPPFDLPRRMYAGEDTVFHRPLRYGDEVEQITRAGDVVDKTGRSGRLVFADVVREYRVGGALAIESTWHDVFLETAPPDAQPRRPVPVPDHDPAWAEVATVDSRQLFRFSAITFNTHRIHYDQDWARRVEGLDDLLVHGPLLRLLLLDAAARHTPGRRPAIFEFRSHAPVLVGTPVTISAADETDVFAIDPDGGLLAHGRVTWAGS